MHTHILQVVAIRQIRNLHINIAGVGPYLWEFTSGVSLSDFSDGLFLQTVYHMFHICKASPLCVFSSAVSVCAFQRMPFRTCHICEASLLYAPLSGNLIDFSEHMFSDIHHIHVVFRLDELFFYGYSAR